MTARITPESVRAVLEAATLGPWLAVNDGDNIQVAIVPAADEDLLVAEAADEHEAALIAAAPSIAAAYLEAAPALEAARAWAAVETTPPQPSSTGVGDWAERREAARVDLLAAVEAAS